MNVSTFVVPSDEARLKLKQYQGIQDWRRTFEDDELESLYGRIKKGARVINIATAFKQTGLNDLGQPRLAIARADWMNVWFHPTKSLGRGTFCPKRIMNERATATNIRLPEATFDSDRLMDTWMVMKSAVPHVPPTCRPKFSLRNYHILFEVKQWEEYPVDPFLLRRISGMLFAVEAEWELTPLEAELLASINL